MLGANRARLRVAALHCLQLMSMKFVYSKLHSHRLFVIKELGRVLDDKKRIVRQLAAIVRNEWILLQT